jgi:hypothetical protein
VVDLAGEPGDPNIVLSKDSGEGPSGSALKTIQEGRDWMVGIKSCNPAHVTNYSSTEHIPVSNTYNGPTVKTLARSGHRKSKRTKLQKEGITRYKTTKYSYSFVTSCKSIADFRIPGILVLWRSLRCSSEFVEQETRTEKSESVFSMHQARFQCMYILICLTEILNVK